MLTERQIDNRVKKIQELEAQAKMIQAQADALKNELKNELESLETEELVTPHFTIRWKVIVSNRLDTTLLKTDLPDIYKKFLRECVSKRFTII